MQATKLKSKQNNLTSDMNNKQKLIAGIIAVAVVAGEKFCFKKVESIFVQNF